MRKLSILQINVTANIGSTGKIAEQIGQAAIREGFRSCIAYGRRGLPGGNELIRIGSKRDNLLHALRCRLLDQEGYGSKKATRELVQKIQELHPDIIHLHNLHSYYLNMEILFRYLKDSGIPVVWTLHDCWPLTGHCCHFDAVGCDRWKDGCFSCPQHREYPASWWFDRSAANYRLKKSLFTSVPNMTLVSVSRWLDRTIGNSFLKNYPRRIIYNGIDCEVFQPNLNREIIRKQLGLQGKQILLGVASVWSPRKGLDDFLALSRQLPRDCVIVLVGLSDAQRRDLPDNVLGLARTDTPGKLAELYSAADVVLNFSLEETFGLTTVEGLACGTPGIVYDRTASPELISDETGWVVAPRSFDSVLQHLETIRRNDRAYYQGPCRARAASMFDNNDRFAEYIALYREILGIKNNN